MKEFINCAEVCDLTGYTKSSIYLKTMKKEIPHYKIGRKVLFKYDEIMTLFKPVPVPLKEKENKSE
jgi:excisionase family DNA binding protein